MEVTKAVITAAGYGTRFLPATKNIPKEMLPLIDVPIIHEVVKECIEGGIDQIIIVTRYGNSAVEDYFDNNTELETYLKNNKKFERYERFMEVFDKADIAYVRQHKSLPYGNGSPILAAKPLISNGEPFAVMWGDDIVLAEESGIGQLREKYLRLKETDSKIGGVIAVKPISREEISKYASVKFKDEEREILDKLIEKPSPEKAPSYLASYGRYILDYSIFDHLTTENTGLDGELWLVDAIHKLAQDMNIYTHEICEWFTTGDPIQYLQTVLQYALKDKRLKEKTLKLITETLRNQT